MTVPYHSFGVESAVTSEPKVDGKIELLWGVKIPMRDGVQLNATVYCPKDNPEPLPVIFTLTPYIGDSFHPRGMYFARNGYIFAQVDVRGRGNSEGHFEPMANEGRDGHDVVEWLACQPWSNGKVTMWGGSYGGFDQWSTLKEFPPHLATIVPVASAFPTVDFPFTKGVFSSYIIQWLTFTSGVTPNTQLFQESSFWIEKFSEMYQNHLPFQELDQIVGNTSTHFQTWINHPKRDDYWDVMAPSDEDFSRFEMPILTITGHYDGDQPGAMCYYRKHMQLGSPEWKDKHYLVIGPWDHAGTRTPNKEFGGMKFGDACMIDMNKLHKEWYDWTLKDGGKPEFLKNKVAYYLMGAEEWKYADSLDAISTENLKLYLGSNSSGANDVFNSGTLTEERQGEAKSDTYVYDPLDVRPGELEQTESESYLTDQRYVLNLFGNGLVYHSEPFGKATEITGYIKLSAWISMDVRDTDLQVSLFEILPDGNSIMLTQDLMRTRYRNSLREEELVTPGEIVCYQFDGFMYFSRLIKKGSRLRLVIQSPNSIHIQKNYNSGGVVALESAKDACTAHITLHHDSERPSYLELPLVK